MTLSGAGSTHDVLNQSEPLVDCNVYAGDRALRDALAFHLPGAADAGRVRLGALLGSEAMQTHARLANVHPPTLHSHDRVGRRIDSVEFHPSYHVLLGAAVGAGLHATPWAAAPFGGASVERRAVPRGMVDEPASHGAQFERGNPASGAHVERGTAASGAHVERGNSTSGAHVERSTATSGAHVERGNSTSGAHVERAAGFLMFTQLEPSVLCPVSMTYAVTPALRGNPALFADWFGKLTSTAYDPALASVTAKSGVTMGMGMTEKQGGSDVRANTTRAEFVETTPWGRCYALVGHKWFFSAPMSDAFLVLAQTTAGLGCFFLPRTLPDGTRNKIAIQRLKDKLGNHANASSEVEFHGALAWLVGEEGRGIAQILEMGTLTRLDCALGTAGLMRGAVALALHHTAQRRAFGKRLVEQPLMKNVLADLALESEAATALALRLARAVEMQDDPFESTMRRVLTPVAKFWICKRGAALGQEAMECLGGNGYVEEHGEGVMARIYREMPLNSIWEGAGNIMALDLLRALKKRGGSSDDDALQALAAELATARASHPAFDHFTDALLARFADAADGGGDEAGARRLAQDVALAVQASLLRRHSPDVVFDAFCSSRLAGGGASVFGTLPRGLAFDAIIERALPH